MNLFELVLKNLRQRKLSSWLTIISVMLGTALGVALLVLQRETPKLFGQSDFGYTLVVGGKGDPLGLVLNNVYLLGGPPPTTAYDVYQDLVGNASSLSRHVEWAIPFAWGDTHRGRRIIGTTPDFITTFRPRLDKPLSLAEGEAFQADTWQAVIGSDAAEELAADIGYSFAALHGSDERGHLHDERWKVVGILARTGTAIDKGIYVPIATQYALGDHGDGLLDQGRARLSAERVSELYEERKAELEALVASGGAEAHTGYVLTGEGRVIPDVPEALWRVSGVFVQTTGGGFAASALKFDLNNGDRATAAVPAEVMTAFYNTFLETPGILLMIVTAGVTFVAAISILVSIYNSVQARRREVAVLRSLGATRVKVLLLVTIEATLIGLVGAIAGAIVGHGIAAVASTYLADRLGGGIAWWSVGRLEVLYLLGVVLLAAVAGLVPALAAYRTPVAQNLTE